jgi:hypothetical protein
MATNSKIKKITIDISDSFRIVNKPKGSPSLDGIARVLAHEPDFYHNKHTRIYIGKWFNNDHSLWIAFSNGDPSTAFVVDSGVILDLADEIKARLKLLKQEVG